MHFLCCTLDAFDSNIRSLQQSSWRRKDGNDRHKVVNLNSIIEIMSFKVKLMCSYFYFYFLFHKKSNEGHSILSLRSVRNRNRTHARTIHVQVRTCTWWWHSAVSGLIFYFFMYSRTLFKTALYFHAPFTTHFDLVLQSNRRVN